VALDFFLKLDGISGESTDAKHKDEIQLESFSWGETNVAGPPRAGGGGAAGRVQMHDLTVTMRVNKASPQLLLACASGKHVKQAVLTVRKAGERPQEFFVLKLTDVVVTSYQTAGSAGASELHDQVALGFAKIEVEYKQQKPNGSLGQSVKAGWDLAQNKPI
jgi:type VI secretion system secreted protein Hcp